MYYAQEVILVRDVATPKLHGPFAVAALQAGPHIKGSVSRHLEVRAIAERGDARRAIVTGGPDESVQTPVKRHCVLRTHRELPTWGIRELLSLDIDEVAEGVIGKEISAYAGIDIGCTDRE